MSTTAERLATAKATALSSTLKSHRALYVGGVDENVTDAILRAALIPFGPILSLDVPKDYQKGTHKGFAFVAYEEANDAAEAMFNMNGAELNGRVLTVNLAQNNEHRLGSAKPVWSSDDWFQQQAGEEDARQRDENQKKEADADALKED